jgi:hypothetical protein
MTKYNFPEDQWQHVYDDDEATFDMQLWSEDGKKYATFCPTYPVTDDDGKWTVSTNTSVETTYLLTKVYFSDEDGTRTWLTSQN